MHTMDRIVWTTNPIEISSLYQDQHCPDENQSIRQHQQQSGNNNNSTTKNKKHRLIIDFTVAIICIPTLLCFALFLNEYMQKDDVTNDLEDDTWIIFVLGAGFLIVTLFMCGYVTHRLGTCLWTGPLDIDYESNSNGRTHIEIVQKIDLPPSYEVACTMTTTVFEMPPPTYDTVIICDEKKLQYFIVTNDTISHM